MKQVTFDEFRVGIDIGGTFTDIIFIGQDGSTITKKVLSTPDEYSRGILTGIDEVLTENDLSASSIGEVVHGSTIVTWGRMAIVDTKPFMLPPTWHSISVHMLQVIRIPV